MLSGEFHHSIDAKNRVSVPAKLREELGTEFMVVRSLRGDCLRFFSIPAWKEYIEPLKKLPRAVSEKTFWFLYHDAAQVSPDSLGRVLLTKGLLDFAKIEPDEAGNRNVVIVGCGDFGEIWSEALYNKHVDEMDIEEIRRSLEESGL
jgi:MraZ protein